MTVSRFQSGGGCFRFGLKAAELAEQALTVILSGRVSHQRTACSSESNMLLEVEMIWEAAE